MGNRVTDEQLRLAEELVRAGETIENAALEVGTTRAALYSNFKRLGIRSNKRTTEKQPVEVHADSSRP